MRRVEEVIVVEGRYDKNALSQVVDAVILETSGFGLFNNREKQLLLRRLAERHGLIVMTDADGSGFVIRNFIKSCVDPSLLKHAYIPDVYGKERRKHTASKEGKIGVEGMPPAVLVRALERAGATFSDEKTAGTTPSPRITKADLYARGLSGREGSQNARRMLLRRLELPERISPNAFLDVLNAMMSREEFISLVISDPQCIQEK